MRTIEKQAHFTGEDCIGLIAQLASSQGFYGRLYASVMDLKEHDPAQYDKLVDDLDGLGFRDGVDFVMYIEG